MWTVDYNGYERTTARLSNSNIRSNDVQADDLTQERPDNECFSNISLKHGSRAQNVHKTEIPAIGAGARRQGLHE
jgi:hypothetical protein